MASPFLYDLYIGGGRKREREYEEVVVNAEIARKILSLAARPG
jgi:hypothetical protein